VEFADGSGHIWSYCPPVLRFAFLAWISMTQWAKHQWSAIDIASVIAVNTRISLMGLSHSYYAAITVKHTCFKE
jgi:hypothetical protein